MRHALKVMSLGTWLMVPASAAAYSSPSLYAADPLKAGGGGGRVFTGAPADGLDCGVCHRGGPVPTQALLGGPGGPYALGATYQFELRWPAGTQLGAAVEATDLAGRSLGELRLAPGKALLIEERCAGGGAASTILVLKDRRPVALGDCGATLMRFQWTAPEVAAEGDLYVAMVLGDGDGTPEGDGAVAFTVPLTTEVAEAGCVIDGGGAWAWAWLLLLRRRRVAGALVLGLTAGCARVQPHERGRLAQPDMKLVPDPDLTAGPEHALEYREGSAGGLGGGGGGCGCN